jgi:YfiR/HmsC-like
MTACAMKLETARIPSRSRAPAALFACAVLTATHPSPADEPSVPLRLQVDLTVKVLEYAQQPALKEASVVHIGILIKPESAESRSFGAELRAVLDRVETIAGRPHDQSVVVWADGASLLGEAKRRSLAVLYLTPGLDAEVPIVARALQASPVITVAASEAYATLGAILSFELVSGHPKMLFNLGQAKRQDVVFRAAVMKLMRIVE